jgi:hypothetical protein
MLYTGRLIDTLFTLQGYGKFHYLFLLVCGLANASDAVEVLCISFLLPSAECELKLTTSDKGWLSAIMFIGNNLTQDNAYSDQFWIIYLLQYQTLGIGCIPKYCA